jgi:hypothetical protein
MDLKTSECGAGNILVACRLRHRLRSLIHLYFFVQISSDGALDGRSLRSIDMIVRSHPTERIIEPLSLPCGESTGARSSGYSCCFRFGKRGLQFQPEDKISSVPHKHALVEPQHRPRELNIFLFHHLR